MTVFAVLCDEINELRAAAESDFYGVIAMFGHAVPGSDAVPKVRTGAGSNGAHACARWR